MINLVSVTFPHPYTQLHLACRRGEVEAVKTLLAEGADAKAISYGHSQPLHQAASQGHAEIVRLLLAAGVDINAQTLTGWTPLHCAARDGRVEVIKVLLAHGALVDPTCLDMRQRPLHVAAMAGETEVCRILLEAGADPHLVDNHNRGPWDMLPDGLRPEMDELFGHHPTLAM